MLTDYELIILGFIDAGIFSQTVDKAIHETQGRIFAAHFIKKDGTLRKMVAPGSGSPNT